MNHDHDKKKICQLRYTSNMSFQYYIREMVKLMGTRVVKGDHRRAGSISSRALNIADAIIVGQFRDIAKEAKKQMVAANRTTLTAWDIQYGVLQRLKGDVARNALSEAVNAVSAYAKLTRRG